MMVHTPVIPALRRLSQEGHEVQALSQKKKKDTIKTSITYKGETIKIAAVFFLTTYRAYC
jgi:hypothetical protein